ncbi:MAG: choice-of-anchor Q domain-containing protein [Marinicella sp.]
MKKNALIILFLSFFTWTTQANLIVVNSNQDTIAADGNCTLREALTAANFDISVDQCGTGLGDDLIWLLISASNDAIQLSNQLPIIDGVEIQGPGADNLVLFPTTGHTGHIFQINTDRDVIMKDFRVSGAQSSAVDVVDVRDLEFNGMRFLNNTATDDVGGALRVKADGSNISFDDLQTIRIIDSEFLQNQAAAGGAVYIDKNYFLQVEGSLFENNTLSVGQLFTPNGCAINKSSSTLDLIREPDTVINSVFINNGSSSQADRNVVFLNNQRADIDRSTFIENADTPLAFSNVYGVVINSLFTANTSDYAISNAQPNGDLSVQFSTFVNNDEAIRSNNATTIIRGNVFDGDGCEVINGGSIISNGYNIEQGNTGNLCTSIGSDMPDTDPMLLPLGYYDGSKLIVPLSPISPAVDAATGCDSNDLSGEGRARDGDGSGGLGQCDMGAVERPNAYILSVSFPGDGDGYVTLDELFLYCNSPDACLWPLPRNESFAFTAAPLNGSTFEGWGNSCAGTGSCNINMDGFKFLTADFSNLITSVNLAVSTFKSETYLNATVTSNPVGISCGQTCSFEFEENETVILTANPASDTVVDYWDGCDMESQDGLECTVFLGSNPQTINIYLDKNPDIIFKSTFD